MNSKDTIKLLIAEYQQKVVDVTLLERPYVLEANLNYVFVGLRRVGKSYLMYQQIRHLLNAGCSKEEILYFNFEDERIALMNTGDLDLIKICYEEMFNSKPIFFLDEIQIVEGWEKFTRRLADQQYRVYVTGSNAKILSTEIATTLGGRYQIQTVFPYSFPEYLTASGIDLADRNVIYQQRTEILKTFENYYRYGGLPEIPVISDKRAWLSNLFQKIFFGDLISRYQIRNDFALRVLIRKLAETVKQPVSFNRLANIVSSSGKKISTDTVIDYLGYLKGAWLIFSVENICARLADKVANQKYYFIDNGILNLFLIDPFTALLENLVAIQLRRVYGSDIYFYHDGIEVDFYVLEEELAIQVCYSLEDPVTLNRKVGALLKIARRLSVKKMMIITKDDDRTLQEKGHEISIIPAWKWLL